MISIVPEYNKSFHPLSIPKCSPWAYLSMDFFFPQKEYWSRLPVSPPGDLSDPGIKPVFPVSPVLQADSFPLSHQGKLFNKSSVPLLHTMRAMIMVGSLWQ